MARIPKWPFLKSDIVISSLIRVLRDMLLAKNWIIAVLLVVRVPLRSSN